MSKKARKIDNKQASFSGGGTSNYNKMSKEQIKAPEEGIKEAERENGYPMLGGSKSKTLQVLAYYFFNKIVLC